MATEVPQYSDSIYKRLRGLRRDIPSYTEDDYKKSVPKSNRLCAGIKVHYSDIPVDCYCPKYGYFEQKVIVGRTLIFYDKETLTYTKSRQRNAFNQFWDVSEKPYIPLSDREKEKKARVSEDPVARSQPTKQNPEASRQDENNVKVKNESGQNHKSEPEKQVVPVEEFGGTHIEACATSQNDDQGQNKTMLHTVTKSKDEPIPNHFVDDNRYSLVIQSYFACCARATDLIKNMRLSMSNREEIVGGNIVRGSPKISISSYTVTADLSFWRPAGDIFVEKTELISEGNRVIQPYSACCARATDLIKHMQFSMHNREDIVGDNIHVEKSEDDLERNINTATFQNGDFENACTSYKPPSYGNENCIVGGDATSENNCQLEEFAVNIETLEQDYNTDFVTGILGIYARGQEHYTIENILTNTDNDDEDDDEDGHDFMSGLIGVYARD